MENKALKEALLQQQKEVIKELEARMERKKAYKSIRRIPTAHYTDLNQKELKTIKGR